MSEIKFTADVMLGGFVRLMRMLGYDVLYDKNSKIEELIERSRKEGRILITKRRRYRFPQDLKVVVLSENYPHEQVQKVLNIHSLTPSKEKFLSRCLICNELLEEASREEVRSKVPEFVYRTHEEFARCPVCGRIYWEGTHHQNMGKMVEMFFKK